MPLASAIKNRYQTVKLWYKKYERWLMPVTLTFGFVADYVTFVSIQVNTALVLLYIYWLIAALAMTFMYAFDNGRVPQKFQYLRLFIPLLIQFTFGGLLSNSFIFYWFSGSVWVSWPFILAFVLLMVSNDALREHFFKPTVQITVYFFASFSIISVTLPFVFNSLNPAWFVLSGFLGLILVLLFLAFARAVAGPIKFHPKTFGIATVVILLSLNFLYFYNLIPPVPLALREVGVYHGLTKRGNAYILKAEKESFLEKLLPGRQVHTAQGEKIYVFSSIFAPKELNTPIVHEWQYKDPSLGWVTKDKLSFRLVGGRQEGFRGYSLKTTLAEGEWRVYIKTDRGQTLGRIKFNITKTDIPAGTVEIIR